MLGEGKEVDKNADVESVDMRRKRFAESQMFLQFQTQISKLKRELAIQNEEIFEYTILETMLVFQDLKD